MSSGIEIDLSFQQRDSQSASEFLERLLSRGETRLRIRKIVLDYCDWFSDDDIDLLSESLQDHSVSYLSLYRCVALSSSAISRLLRHQTHSLTYLKLAGNPGVDDQVVQTIAGCRQLSVLSLTRCQNVSDVGLEYLNSSECVELHHSLTELHLYGNSGMSKYDFLSRFSRLRALDLCGHCNFRTADLENLLGASSEYLKVVNFSWCIGLDSAAIDVMVRYLDSDRWLPESISLFGLKELDSAEKLIRALSRVWTVESIDYELDLNGIPAVYDKYLANHCQGLKEAIPCLKVTSLHG